MDIGATESLSERLADFASTQTTFPENVLNEGKRIVLDQMACQIACAPLPWSVAFLDAVKDLGPGTGATVVYFGDKLSLDQTAFVNATFGHGGEYDDTQLRSNNHSGAVVLPPVLAIAESRKLSGAELLTSLIVGLEVMIRVAAAVAPHLFNRGHHVPPASGTFGAAAGSARILGLSQKQTAQALAISGSHSGGHLEHTHGGGSVKRSHCGIPAMSGLRSAMMAARGITGPRSILEGPRGFFQTFAGAYDEKFVTEGLGEKYYLLETSYKAIASPYPAHAPLQALDAIIKAHNLQADEIASILIGTSTFAIKAVGNIREPKGILDAHFSLPFGVAVRLFRGGNGFYDYREEDLADPRFLKIAREVKFEVDPICEEERLTLNTRSAVVTVETKSGARHSHRLQYPKGHHKNPLSDEELTAKFLDAVVLLLGPDRSKRIADSVWAIEKMKDAGELVRLTLRDG